MPAEPHLSQAPALEDRVVNVDPLHPRTYI
jgi:hypothetical protein